MAEVDTMRTFWFWFIAVLITLVSAAYQRVTGPSYPQLGKATVGGSEVRFRLPRSAETTADCEIAVRVSAPVEGYLEYRRHKTNDVPVRVPLVRRGEELTGSLPKQPAPGKLDYEVFLTADGTKVPLGKGRPTTVRFKDPVPAGLLIPHILVMFGGMLASTAAGLAALKRKRNPRRFVIAAVVLLFLGGVVLGSLVQKAAFGVYWSGFPLGKDMTDTKTLVSLLLWIAALIATRKGRTARAIVLAAWIVTLAVYFIPHSVFGS